MNEIWKSPPNLSKYEVSNFGNIRNTQTKELFKEHIYNGYNIRCGMVQDNTTKRKNCRIHRLVALCFIDNPNSKDFPDINHIDGNKANNHVSNLEWSNATLNNHHAIDTGLRKCSPFSKLTKEIVREMRHLFDTTNETTKTLAVKYDVNKDIVKRCLIYNSWARLDVEKRYSYKINSLTGLELTQFLAEKGLKDPATISPPIELFSEDNYIKNEEQILKEYFTLYGSISSLCQKYKISRSFLKEKLCNVTYEIKNQKGEIFKLYNKYLISNMGRVILDGRIIIFNRDEIVKMMVETFTTPPPNTRTYKIVGELRIENIKWVTYKYDKEKIRYEAAHSTESTRELYTRLGISQDVFHIITRGVKRPDNKEIAKYIIKPAKCSCGETNPDEFNQHESKSKCKSCFKKSKPFLCKICGENNQENFEFEKRNRCILCKNSGKRVYHLNQKNISKKCKVCGETKNDKFEIGVTVKCVACKDKSISYIELKILSKECKICGETQRDKFDVGISDRCISCKSIHSKKMTEKYFQEIFGK